MSNKIKYCRFKGFKLQVLNIQNEIANLITSDWATGKLLNMEFQDRDRIVMNLPINQLECIWEFGNGWRYDTIHILQGEIKSLDYPNQYDHYDSDYIHNGEFASYRGTIYRSISGYPHSQVFNLLCYSPESQELGFIMEKPGLYYKCVSPDSVSFAYKSLTYCTYNELEFVVAKKENNKILIEPYSAELYEKTLLTELGFELINTKMMKWINPEVLESVWVKTEPLFDFKNYKKIEKSW